ncbi:MAG TPA: FG-GAP-like repeat-containing protein [Myxococcales bacterium]|jgi:hypothetical protein
MLRRLSIALLLAGCTSAASGTFDGGSCAAADCAALPAPTLIEAHAGNGFLLARWTQGAANVTGYTVVAAPASGTPQVFHTAETSLLATGLENGTAYSVTVAAVVAGGTGPSSAAISVTPAATCARSFALHRTYATLASPGMVAMGDFDQDGFLDVAVTQAGGVGVFMNDRTGTLLPRTDRALSATPTSLVSADFNFDGLFDLAAGGAATSVLYSDGGVVDIGGSSSMLAAADVNLDGVPDLVLGGTTPQVALDDGDGGFGPAQLIPGAAAATLIAAGNFDTDGLASLAVASPGAASFQVLGNPGDGGVFVTPVSYPLSAAPLWIAAGDFDGDGLVDLAFPAANGQILIHPQQAVDGGFGVETQVASGTLPAFLAAVDVDLDNLDDLVYTAPSQNRLGVLLHGADGGFAAPLLFPTGGAPASVAAGDLNGDGLPDLVVANSADNTVSVFINVCAQ